MDAITHKKLQQLMAHNEKTLKYAEAGDWEKVTENEKIRQQLIKSFYSSSSDEHDTVALANATQELLLVNEKLKQLAINARDKVSTERNDINKGKQAINAYTRNMD